ncbi:MAG: type 4a pilus biogenesis protein PilO [Desulfobacterales bacterium]|nr:type 4a pilus biogenesis protein PilO [Desulfobacterales bacterium]
MITISIKQLDRACLITVVIVSLVCGFVAVRHVTNKKRFFETERNVLLNKMKEINLAATNLETLQVNLTDIKKELSDLNERIPETGKIGLLLQQIDALMKRHEITLISIEPLPVSQDKIYLRNPIKLLFKGSFVNSLHLIRNLEGMNRIMVMETLTITREEISDQCQVELTTTVFERPKAI